MTEGTQARPERVMVLEPDAERRQMLAQTLMQSGFRCFMADSLHDALPAPPRDDGRRALDTHRAGICLAGSAGENAGGSRLPRNAPADGVGISGFRRNTHGGRAHSAFAAETGQIVHRNGL